MLLSTSFQITNFLMEIILVTLKLGSRFPEIFISIYFCFYCRVDHFYWKLIEPKVFLWYPIDMKLNERRRASSGEFFDEDLENRLSWCKLDLIFVFLPDFERTCRSLAANWRTARRRGDSSVTPCEQRRRGLQASNSSTCQGRRGADLSSRPRSVTKMIQPERSRIYIGLPRWSFHLIFWGLMGRNGLASSMWVVLKRLHWITTLHNFKKDSNQVLWHSKIALSKEVQPSGRLRAF